jgi:hypothetical protein
MSSMNSFPELTLDSWIKLTAVAEQLDIGDAINTPYLYRGQASFEWKLTPSLHRAASNDDRRPLPPTDRLLVLEQLLTDRFAASAPTFLPPATFASVRGVVDWWPLMRHHGVPTRILDWTASFFVAAYFAAVAEPDKDGAIYLLHGGTLQVAMNAAHGDAAKYPRLAKETDQAFRIPDAPPVIHIFDKKTAKLDRMVVQQGTFMLNRNAGANIEEVLATEMLKHADPAKVIIRKFRIPAALKPMVMRRLRSMNVTGSSLFPGLDGIGRQLDELLRNE